MTTGKRSIHVDTDACQTQNLRVGHITLNYKLQGHGEPLVCLHGVGSYLEAWDEVARRLADRYRVLTFDLRGHGASSKMKGPYQVDEFVDDVLALVEHVGFATFHLAGFSLGGLIAQRLALTHGPLVRSLVLLSTVAGRTRDERERVEARLAALQSGERGSHYDASVSRWLTEEFQARNSDVVDRLRQRNAENDPECYAAAYRVLAQTDFGESLNELRMPVLVVTGEEDAGSNPRMARFMHEQIAGSELRILPRLRHSILTEVPDQVAQLMGDFFERRARGATR